MTNSFPSALHAGTFITDYVLCREYLQRLRILHIKSLTKCAWTFCSGFHAVCENHHLTMVKGCMCLDDSKSYVVGGDSAAGTVSRGGQLFCDLPDYGWFRSPQWKTKPYQGRLRHPDRRYRGPTLTWGVTLQVQPRAGGCGGERKWISPLAFGGWCCHVGPFVDGPSTNTQKWWLAHFRSRESMCVCSMFLHSPMVVNVRSWPKKQMLKWVFATGGQRVPSTRRSSEKSCCSSTKGASDAPWMPPGCPRTRRSDWATQLVCSPRNPAQDKWKKMDGWLNGQHIYEAGIKKKSRI